MLFPNSRGNEAVANQSLTKPLNIGSLGGMATASAAVKPTKKVELQLALKYQLQVYWEVDSSHVEFQRAVTTFELEGDVFRKRQ